MTDFSSEIAPRFMSHIVNRVLAAGKTMDFIKRMDPNDLDIAIDDDKLLYKGEVINPFEQGFERALEEWIMKKYEISSKMLRERSLHRSSELWKDLDCIHGIYCMTYYHSMMKFISTLFEKVTHSVSNRRKEINFCKR